jgi:hypothetical protein
MRDVGLGLLKAHPAASNPACAIRANDYCRPICLVFNQTHTQSSVALHVTATANLRRSPRLGVPAQLPEVTLMCLSAAAACGSPTETVRMPSR